MRLAVLSLVGLTACAQLFGLEQPNLLAPADGATDGTGDGRDAIDFGCWSDDFNDNMLDMARWTQYAEHNNRVFERNQQLELELDNSPGSAYCGIETVKTLSATDTGAQVEVVQPSGSGATESALMLAFSGANQLILSKDDSSLRTIVKTGGANDTMTIVWDPAIRFLRIERSGDKVTFSTSADGMTWSALRTAAATFASQNLTASVYAGHYQAAAAAIVVFDNFKVLSATCM